MSKEKRFSIGIGGYEFYADRFDDMPEAVRAYLDELHSQLSEEGGEDRIELPDACMPPEVDEYFQRKARERLDDAHEDPNSVRAEEYPADRLEEIMDRAVDRVLAIVLKHADSEEGQAEARRTAFIMKGAFRATLAVSSEWRALGAQDAALLYDGVVKAVLTTALSVRELEVKIEEQEADSDDEEAE